MLKHIQIGRLQKIVSLFQNLSLLQAGIFVKEKLGRKKSGGLFNAAPPHKLSPKHSDYPLTCRPNTSDIDVFGQIFIQIVIELYDNSAFGKASDVFFNAISDRAFDISGYGELTVCKSH
jgi:hypothetical protein